MSPSPFLSKVLLLASVAVIAAPVALLHQTYEKQAPDPKTQKEMVATRDTNIVFPTRSRLAPALLVKLAPQDTGSVPLGINRVKMGVTVTGNIATTRMELCFYNNTDRILEGEFVCPLGEGQSMSYFAFEVDGELREGVVVEKEKARQVFESVVRRNIDPGLLEWTKGNNFRSRIYPIPAHGIKKIIVGFDQELVATGVSAIYQQPLLFNHKLESFDLDVEVLRQEVKPELYGDERVNLSFEKWQESWKAHYHTANQAMTKALGFEVPVPAGGAQYTQQIDADSAYFYLSLQPEKLRVEKPAVKTLCLLWDVSGSAAARDTAKELALLGAYLKQLGNPSVKLVTFSNAVHDQKQFQIANGNWTALKDELNKQVYDGATQLGVLGLAHYEADEYVLFSDGMSNFGKTQLGFSHKPVYTVCSGQQADYSMLKYIAQKSGGSFINLSTTTATEAIAQLGKAPYQFLYASYGSGASQVYPSMPSTIANGLSLSGILKSPEAELVLNFGVAGKVMKQQRITLRKGKPMTGAAIGRQWAQQRINELDMDHKAHEAEITRLGKAFSIVTRNTSLLILDNIADYVAHRIVPPTEKLRKEYFAQISKEEKSAVASKQEHLDNVWEHYKSLREWYGQKFESICETEKTQKEKGFRGARADSIWVSGEALNETEATPAAGQVLHFADVQASVQASSGAVTYNFSASNSALNAVPGVVAGTYKVVVGNANGCSTEERGADIKLKEWNPNTPYLRTLKKVAKENLYSTYLDLRKQYSTTPAFYIDVADYLLKQGLRSEALRVLSNIAELETENHQLLRVLAHRLQQIGEEELAICVYKDILEIRGEEPQSYRDLGLAYAQHKQYQLAVDYLCRVVNKTWDGRFPGIECIAINEINNVAAKDPLVKLDSLDKRFRNPLQADVRIVINWDSDNCDMDLWVTDPCGEKCYYSNPHTAMGGRLSNDFTGGYGPEEFMVKRGVGGSYVVEVNYFGSRQQTLYGQTTVQAELYTNYGRPNEVKKEITLRLSDNKDVQEIGALAFAKN